jgi:hypothetical protein
MKKSSFFPVTVVTILLIVYTILLATGASPVLAGGIFLLSPFLIIWMVYRVIRHDTHHGRELMEGEEWGYTDKNKESLGIF